MKIEELTDRLLKEGVEKGNQEAEKIIQDAKRLADEIVENAKNEAQQIKAKTENELNEMKNNVKAELQLGASQLLGSLKTDITDIVCGRVVDDNIKAITVDTDFICQIISKMADQMLKDGNVTIETNLADQLTAYFEKNTKNLLNSGITIHASSGNKMKFSLICEQKNYKLQFGEDEMKEFFKSFLRQRVIDYIF